MNPYPRKSYTTKQKGIDGCNLLGFRRYPVVGHVIMTVVASDMTCASQHHLTYHLARTFDLVIEVAT
jgi:hypothetical protein